MEYVNKNKTEVNLKFLNSAEVYSAIQVCNSKVLNITYCSLKLDDICMDTKTVTILIRKLHQNCDFIEGTILKNSRPFEDIVLKSSRILKVECSKDTKPDENLSIYDTIKYCEGLVKITQCSKIEKGKCIQKKSFPFLVGEIDTKNNIIKGYRIRDRQPPEYIILDTSLILDVECITKNNSPNFPWGMIPFLMMNIKK